MVQVPLFSTEIVLQQWRCPSSLLSQCSIVLQPGSLRLVERWPISTQHDCAFSPRRSSDVTMKTERSRSGGQHTRGRSAPPAAAGGCKQTHPADVTRRRDCSCCQTSALHPASSSYSCFPSLSFPHPYLSLSLLLPHLYLSLPLTPFSLSLCLAPLSLSLHPSPHSLSLSPSLTPFLSLSIAHPSHFLSHSL